ncbi:hydrocephalus-inducing protein homolog [Rhinophrynus dorsalis]
MPSDKLPGLLNSSQELPFKLPSGFQSKVVAPRNPKLTRDEGTALTLTPSAFLREMSLTTEQKLASTREMHPPRIIELLDMSETTHQKFSSVDLDQALFQPFPSEIVFQNYTACETYEVPLVLRNNDKVPRLVKVIQENSPYFQIISPKDVCNKVAPGMPSIFHILFNPEENKDYFHELICITEREKFVVPIRAIGARAMLDFPDLLSFSVCPVKYNSQKPLLVRNIGNREACFQLLTQRPFSVDPVSGTLGVGESMQVLVEFQPQAVGDHTQDLIIHYDTGEDIHVTLYGAATDINVRLDKYSAIIEKTFLSLANQRTVTVSNRSDIITHFQWKAFASQQEEDHQKQRSCSDLQSEEEEETDCFLEECRADPSLRERLSILSRTFHNQRRLALDDAMLFTDDIFQIEPVEGDVWPNSSVEVSILFKPQEAKLYQRTVYCDITGREARLPLRIRGEGIGPKLLFNFDQLDIGKIFVGSTHSYEVILTNKGLIDGIFTLAPPSTAVDSCFTFIPSEGIILPAGHQAIQISICCSVLGEFSQAFHFNVDGSPDPITLTIRGCIIGPTFHFSLPSLCFGDVSFGFPRSLTCSLNNTSLVPMTFNLRIPGDGCGEPSITSFNQILDERRSSWRRRIHDGSRPREFSITPSRGTIRSQGILDIEVTFCSNQEKKYELALVVDVDGIGDEVLALPITARCVVPSLCLEDAVLMFSRCFLQYPYQRTVTLMNISNLPACYGLLPQEPEATSSVVYYSPKPRGVIGPHGTVEIPIVVEAQFTGELSIKAHIGVLGSIEPPLEVELMCIGEGPVVHVYPSEVDFGNIDVLTDVSRTLHLSNQSLIPARFQANMTRKHSLWRIEPSHGEVPPEGEVQLTLVAHLDDTITFKDKVQLVIENSNTHLIPLHATGTGTTIVTDRTFAPVLHLGAHFSAGPCRYHFTMTNQGRRTHQLYWITEGFPQFRKRPQLVSTKPGATNTEPPCPVFRLSPSRMELHPGQSIDVVLEGSSDIPKVVKERLVGQAIIGKQSGKERIMTVDVICEFIAPVLNLSAKKLHFYVEKQKDDSLVFQYKSLIIKNISSLPLTIFLSLSHPFSINNNGTSQNGDTEPLILEAGEDKELTIRFDPTYIHDQRSQVIEEALTIQYAEHPHTDFVTLQGEVHFPNLHFPCTQINFGCILNDTESVQELEVTNCSPLPVQYRWSFLTENWDSLIRFNATEHKPAVAMMDAVTSNVTEVHSAEDETHTSGRETEVQEAEVLQRNSVKDTVTEPSTEYPCQYHPEDSNMKEWMLDSGSAVVTQNPQLLDVQLLEDSALLEKGQLLTGVEEVIVVSSEEDLPSEEEEDNDGEYERMDSSYSFGDTYESNLLPSVNGLIRVVLETLQVSDEPDEILMDEGKTPDKRLFLSKCFYKLYPFSTEALAQWTSSPTVDPQFHGWLRPTDAAGLKEPAEKRRTPGSSCSGLHLRSSPLWVDFESAEVLCNSLLGSGFPGYDIRQGKVFLLEEKILFKSQDVSQVFDILPLFGTLQPGESQIISFTFYGHSGISSQAVALCEVNGGPTYEISLHGEASLVSYMLSTTDIDYGIQLFDQVAEATVILRNTGRVSFPYTVINQNSESILTPMSGEPLVQPVSGHIAAGEEEILKVMYFPGVPGSFQRTIQLQVAHMEPESIALHGEAVFPRICLDLPRNIKENEKLQTYLMEAEETMREKTHLHSSSGLAPTPEHYDATMDPMLLMEMERILMKEHATELLEQGVQGDSTQRTKSKLHKVSLPEYLLDFGFVILGEIRTHVIKITNTGHFPVSFRADRHELTGTGFSTELDRVKNLPCCQTETFQVKFDPRGANLSLGPVDVVMLIQVSGGPRFPVRLRASVTMPSLSVSSDMVEFGHVQCGQCQIRSVQLYNQLPVLCEWTVMNQENEVKIDKHTPMHLRKKLRKELKPKSVIFEMMPATGVLLPGEKKNVEIRFIPREEKLYSQRLVLQVAQSSQRVMLLVQGQGLEPRLEFTPSVLELGPILPFSPGDDVEVLVKNPCSFPIEFYSLEMDKQYVEEEKILRMLKGYDFQNTLLLPPRLPGEKLPSDILEYYEEQKRLQEESGQRHRTESHGSGAVGEDDEHASYVGDKHEPPGDQRIPSTTDSHSTRGEANHKDAEDEQERRAGSGEKLFQSDGDTTKAVGELEQNPVSRAIARYMGIDISNEGRAASNRRGIAIIVHGAPLTGKSSAAVALAHHYSIACLSIDSVVLDAISDENSLTGLRARQLCAKAAFAQALRESEETALQTSEAGGGQSRLSMEALAKHTAEGGQGPESKIAPQSIASRATRGSLVAGKGKSESHVMQGGKQQHVSEATGSQTGSSPLPVGPTQKRLSVSASVGGEFGLMSCMLPEDLLQEILSERLQLNDCFRGVVFDGLDTLFARNAPSALNTLLKSLNNRRHIYLINLRQEYAAMKAREKAQKQQEEEERLRADIIEKAHMEEMDEEEYDNLPTEERERIDGLRLQAMRERKKREQEERLAREEHERKLQEELQRQREEDELKKKTRRGKSRDSGKEDSGGKKSQMGNKQLNNIPAGKSDLRMDSGFERKVALKDRPDSVANELDDYSKRRSKEFRGGINTLQHVTMYEEPEKEPLSEGDKQLIQRFKMYESCQKEILHISTFWDRVQGILLQPPYSEDSQHEVEDLAPELQAPSGKKSRKDRERQEKLEREKAEREKQEKERTERERLDKLRPIDDYVESHPVYEGEGHEEAKMELGVPLFDFQVSGPEEPSGQKIIQSGKLPSVEEILDGLGLGPSGPPIPPSFLFSVVNFPERRTLPNDQETLGHFTFIAASPDDPNVLVEEKKEPEAEAESVHTISMLKEEQLTPTKTRIKKEKAADMGRESQKDKRRSASHRKNQQNLESHSPPPITNTPFSDVDQSSSIGEVPLEKLPRLNTFRWIVPPGGEVPLRIHFASNSAGNFDQTLNFELLGTHRKYQLYCRGVCAFPTISQEPKVVFPHRKKEAKPDEIVQKKFILNTGTFDFGPLLCGKSREKYKAGQFPENMEKITIHNESPMDTEITFCFQHDIKAITFILDPPAMNLKPNGKQELSIWAFPTSPGLFEDNVVCCIKDNPEPAIFHICCRGVRPELELDRKQIHFDKILLHRKDTRTIFLRNSTLLPAAWRVTGLENLGDDFSISQDQGIVGPRSEYGLQLHFKAAKATNVKKTIRMEVSDIENILGIVQLENIQVFAESYDVALDISFPKGTDGGLDFGVVKVNDEAKHTISLKNKGKYEIAFSFSMEVTGPGMPDLNSLFSILPQKGTLGPNDRATQVQILFQSKKEVQIADKPILRCQVIEPSLSEGGETIASIPIRLSVQSVFSKYRLCPSSVINFGAMVLGSRKLCSFTLENCSHLEFRFNISKLIKEEMSQPVKKGPVHGMKRSRSREGSGSSRSVIFGKAKRTDSQLKDMNSSGQARLAMGMFIVSPGFGSVPPGGHVTVNVECFADQLGRSEEFLAIDISDRHPEDNPNGIPFRLVTESCTPGFVTDDIASIFEEHRIVGDARILQCLPSLQAGGIYLQEEKRFLFWNVLVGQTSTARFKIMNTGKVPCDVVLTVKPMSAKSAARISDIFEVNPPRMSIPSHSHCFASVTFSPQSMQTYQCIFEAAVEGAGSAFSRNRNLSFDISGEGNLPRVTISRPVLRNKRGNPLLLFQRLLMGQHSQLPLEIKNEGSIPAQLNIDLPGDEGVFTLKPKPNTHCIYPAWRDKEDPEPQSSGRRPHTASLILHPGDIGEFDVFFHPANPQRYESILRLSVVDNQYEQSYVQLVGEGFQDELTLDNIHSPGETITPEGPVEEDVVEATRTDHIIFGDCHIGRQYQVTFSMTNRSKEDVMKFQWPSEGPLHFSPQVGHIHAGCAKDVSVTLKSDVALSLSKAPVKCKVSRISFPLPRNHVADWDDQMRTVKWVDAGKSLADQRPTKKKVIETDPEPTHVLLDEVSRELELLITAQVDHAQYQANSDQVQFKDTLLYQTRVYKYQMKNIGSVQLQFSWQVQVDGHRKSVNFSPRLAGTDEPLGSARTSSGQSRPGSVLESVSSLLSMGIEALPISVQPSSGTIPAGGTMEFLIKFSPLEVGEFEGRLACSIPNLSKEQQAPVLLVKGRSILPYCHFQLEDSDYITQGRRNPELRGPNGAPSGTTLDPNTRVIEFTSVGVKTKKCRTFSILNPTNSPYSFQWNCEDPLNFQTSPAFHCLNERGVIQPEKKVEVTFEFVPQVLDITESFWSFIIPEQKISVPFLLAGKTTEPCVSLDRSHLNFSSIFVGHEVEETVYLLNNEDQSLTFTFRESSRFSEGFSHSLLVKPMEGTISPRSRLPIRILIQPSKVGELNFNLICDVQTKTEPLILNVKAEGHTADACVQYQDRTGTITTLMAQTSNEIDLGQVDINDSCTLQFNVMNNGRFPFSFSCVLSTPQSLQEYLSISPGSGYVGPGQLAQTSLTFYPTRKCILKDTELCIKIENGPELRCCLRAKAVKPGINFSFIQHNFGNCFIYQAGMHTIQKTLIITNKDDKDVSLDCLYNNSAQLEVDFHSGVLPPGGMEEVHITFYPRAAVLYQENVIFQMNGHSTQAILFQGRGTEMKVEVADPKYKVTNFGAVSIGQTVKKTIPIVNNSVSSIKCFLTLSPSVPALQDPKVLSMSPSSEVAIPAHGGVCNIQLQFTPQGRIGQFAEEVMLEVAGLTRSLLVLRGCSQGLEMSLDQEYISFGAVVLQCQASRRIILSNTGELGARFHWDIKKFQPDFSISPASGYITAGTEVTFDVTFHPCEVNTDIHYENLSCFIEGSSTLMLTLSGSCVGHPSTKEVVSFQCQVRNKQTQAILLSNKTNRAWNLHPIIDGEHWKGPDVITVEAQQSKPYEITYHPLIMSSEGKKHQGSIFFPLPDGTGLMYLLHGLADPPKSSGNVIREVPCKTSYTELLAIHNWLNKTQRFRVIVEMVKPDRLDNSTTIKGLDYIEVPGAARREYKLSFHSYKEGTFSTKITFRNETTQEYQFYYVTFKATPPGIISTIEMVTPVRQSTAATVKVENPLPVPVTFTTDCKVSEINLPPQLTVPAQSEGTLMFEYQPLKSGETVGRLTLQSTDLGLFQYELILKAMPALPEKPLYFRTTLGSSQTLSAKFINFSKQKTEYSCKVDNSDFHVEKVVMAAPGSQGGSEVSVEVTYEPIQLGESRAILLLTSPLGGEYTIPLFGSALAPKPQGPIQIRSGSSISIPFKNVFLQPTTFTFLTDHPAFTVKPCEPVRPKKTHYISVSYEAPQGGSKVPVTGKLVISCPRAIGIAQGICWVYYLKGVVSEK